MRVTIDRYSNGLVIDHQDPNSDERIQTVVEELVNETPVEYGRRVLHQLMNILGLCDSESRYSEERLFVCIYPGDKSEHDIDCPLCFSTPEERAQTVESAYAPVTGEESQIVEKPKGITVREARDKRRCELRQALINVDFQTLRDELGYLGMNLPTEDTVKE
jgi:hypothetical protein